MNLKKFIQRREIEGKRLHELKSPLLVEINTLLFKTNVIYQKW